MKRIVLFAAALAAVAGPAAAQRTIDNVCGEVPDYQDSRVRCAAVAQAVDAAQPQLGILMAGGNPTLGTASTGGVRFGVAPRVSVTARVNVVGARLPDIRDVQSDAQQATTDQFSVPMPAVGANVSVGVFPGFSLAPMIGGFGSVDLLGSVTLIPLELAGDEFGDNAVSWGAGARVGLIRESFVTPGVSVSLMYRDMGDMSFGDVCAGTETQSPTSADRRLCTTDGDFGEIAFGLSNWSTRAAVSKRFLGLGLSAGVGYDKFDTDADFAFRAPAPPLGNEEIYRYDDVAVDNDRWSAFVDGSFTLLLASVVAEAGWMQGADPIAGFPSTSDFDPNKGTFFGSLGFRLAL